MSARESESENERQEENLSTAARLFLHIQVCMMLITWRKGPFSLPAVSKAAASPLGLERRHTRQHAEAVTMESRETERALAALLEAYLSISCLLWRSAIVTKQMDALYKKLLYELAYEGSKGSTPNRPSMLLSLTRLLFL